ELPGVYLEAEYVRDSSIEGAAVQKLRIGREHEAFGHGRRKVVRSHRFGISFAQCLDAEHLEVLAAVDFPERRGEQFAVGRYIELVRHLAVRPDVYQLPLP